MIGLGFIFIILAIISGYKGFDISWQGHQTGTTQDADFWYLYKSNVMFVFGNLTTALPRLQRNAYKWKLIVFISFFNLRLLCAINSIVIYQGHDTGFSALVSFLGSVASAAFVVALIQAIER